MERMPTLFVSHGSPMLAITDSPAHRFLLQLGKTMPRPQAIVMLSAHWEALGSPAVSFAATPDTIHDFGGFPSVLSQIQYPAPGAPAVAEQAAALLQAAGYAVKRSPERGLDHGAWVPLSLMYPEADIPTLQVSVLRGQGAAEHEQLGRALAPLREQGVLIVGSGSFTHNLYEFHGQDIDTPPLEWVRDFKEWMDGKLMANERAALLDYRRQAPFAARNHPSEEHLVPLFAAMGAAGEEAHAQHLHSSYEYEVLAMDAYAFS